MARTKVGNGYVSKNHEGYTVFTSKTGSPVGSIAKGLANAYAFRLFGCYGWHQSTTRAEAVNALLDHVRSLKRAKAYRKAHAKCLCREPKRHRDCMYCGSGYWGEVVCGVCKEQGIDGKVIRGTERRVCSKHKASQ